MPLMARAPRALGLLLLSFLAHATLGFREGDFIQTARRAQFQKKRTNWHDLLGHHCPRFGEGRVVAVPLPKPEGVTGKLEEYKIQFSFDGDRHLTAWHTILGKGAPVLPMLSVEVRTAGDEILGVNAKVVSLPSEYIDKHSAQLEKFSNASHWPKHLLVSYTTKAESDINLDRGLYVVFAIGLTATFLLGVSAFGGVGPKLAQFLEEMTSEGPAAAAAGAPAGGVQPTPANGGALGGLASSSSVRPLVPPPPPVWKMGPKGD